MIFKDARLMIILVMCNLVFEKKLSAQKIECNTITSDMGYKVGSVKIIGRWVAKDLQTRVEQTIGLGETFDPVKVGPAEQLVKNEIIKSEDAFAIRLTGSTSVLFVTSDVCPLPDSLKSVQIVIHPYYLRIDLYNTGNNILPIPRTAKPAFYKQVPTVLLATAPFIGLINDRRYGVSATLQTTTDLLQIFNIKKPGESAKKFRLNLGSDIRKSFNDAFNSLGAVLEFARPVYADTIIGWNIGIAYAHDLQPLGIGEYKRDLTRIFGSITGSGKISFLNKYALGASVRFLQNLYNDILPNNKFQIPETDYEITAVGDGRVGKGFSRIGIRFNAGIPKNNATSFTNYERLATRFGYAVSLGKGHNNVDVETALGFGYIWGSPPTYSQFFAGNTVSNFIDASPNSLLSRNFSGGPVIRSLGEKEGGIYSSSGQLSGGTSYWGLNLSFSIPFSKWAHPLIPDIVIADEPHIITLRSALKGQVQTAKNFIANDLALNGGLSDDAADSAAERIVNKDIRPTLNYLADRANVYSIKPLLYFDLGQVNKRNVADQMYAAAGTGLQINIVNARLELGYMQTVSPQKNSSKGNFLMRFTVQNFY